MNAAGRASGSGDLARAMAKKPGVEVWMTDINATQPVVSMMNAGTG